MLNVRTIVVTSLLVFAVSIIITAHSVISHAAMRLNHTVTVENNTELYVVVEIWDCDGWEGWKAFDVPPVSERFGQFKLPAGCKNITVKPAKCGNYQSFPKRTFQTNVSGSRLYSKVVLTDSTFGKRHILPQCPDRMGQGQGGGGSGRVCPQIITANEFKGTWNNPDWGEMRLDPSGSSVTGSYGHDQGEIKKTSIVGRVLKGQWHEKAQNDAKKGPRDWGYFEFTLSGNCKSINGKWRYSNESRWREDWDLTFVRN